MTKKRKITIATICAALVLIALAAFFILKGRSSTDSGDGVYMQKISDLNGYDFSADRFSGVVEAQKTQSFKKDPEKKVEEIYVKVGQEVKEGTPLFKYDVKETEHQIQSTNLDIEGLNNEIAVLRGAGSSTEIQLQISEKELEIRQKEADLEQYQQELDHAEVLSSINGIVKLVSDEGGSNNQGEELPVVAITEMGEFRIKGKVSEQSISSLYPGMNVIVRSRVDESQIWMGTVSTIETDPSGGNNENGGGYEVYEGESSEKASSYPFYINMDNTDGLMLGQHVFIEPDYGQSQAATKEGLWIDMSFVVQEEDGTTFVWSSERGKVVKKVIETGEIDEESYTIEILSGLSEDDLIAWPDETIKEGMKAIELTEGL